LFCTFDIVFAIKVFVKIESTRLTQLQLKTHAASKTLYFKMK